MTTIEDYKDLIRRSLKPDYDDLITYCMVGIAGEAGEIANLTQKCMRGDFPSKEFQDRGSEIRKKLICELGGLLYFFHATCMATNIHPEFVMAENARLIEGRLKRGTIRGDGDDR